MNDLTVPGHLALEVVQRKLEDQSLDELADGISKLVIHQRQHKLMIGLSLIEAKKRFKNRNIEYGRWLAEKLPHVPSSTAREWRDAALGVIARSPDSSERSMADATLEELRRETSEEKESDQGDETAVGGGGAPRNDPEPPVIEADLLGVLRPMLVRLRTDVAAQTGAILAKIDKQRSTLEGSELAEIDKLVACLGDGECALVAELGELL